MTCIECHRRLGQPYVMTSAGAVGPKCAANLGLQRPRVAKDRERRVRVTRARTRRTELQLELAL